MRLNIRVKPYDGHETKRLVTVFINGENSGLLVMYDKELENLKHILYAGTANQDSNNNERFTFGVT